MYIQDDGIRLNTILEKPAGNPAECPLVIILHGYTGNCRDKFLETLAHALNGMGYATLRADLYGHGESGGEFRDHTLFKWMNNAMALTDYARSLPWVTEILLCGHSQGGLTAILASALERDVISGVIALAPAMLIPEGARTGSLAGCTFDPEHLPDHLDVWGGRVLGSNYVRTAQVIQPEEYAARYAGPALVIHGTGDRIVPCRWGEDIAKAFPRGEYVSVPDDSHGFDLHPGLVLETIRRWLAAPRG